MKSGVDLRGWLADKVFSKKRFPLVKCQTTLATHMVAMGTHFKGRLGKQRLTASRTDGSDGSGKKGGRRAKLVVEEGIPVAVLPTCWSPVAR